MNIRSIRNAVVPALAFVLCFCGWTGGGRAGEVPAPNTVFKAESAPGFELPIISGEVDGKTAGDNVKASDLFAGRDFTFLIFWESGCPHCVQSLSECEEFYQEFGGGGIGSAGICGGRGRFAITADIEAAGTSFPMLWDRDDSAASGYGADYSSFSIFLVAGNGEIISRADDPEGNVQELMLSMLSAAGTAREERVTGYQRALEEGSDYSRKMPEKGEDSKWIQPGKTSGEAGLDEGRSEEACHAGFSFSGDVRIRFISTDSRGESAVDPYGQEVKRGNGLLSRFELVGERRIGGNLKVGGLVRVSNEGIERLRSGPKYFDSEWGSAFAEFSGGDFEFRLGYYPVSMTPLTMMRWDWDDNPRVGGDGGCTVCGGAAGAMTFMSLEELGPDLVFEGGRGAYSGGRFELELFYAIPRRVRDTSPYEAQYGGIEPACYSLEAYGLDARWRRPDDRTGSAWKAGLHLAGTREDESSFDAERIYGFAFPSYDSYILSATAEVPLLSWLKARGEWVISNQAEGKNIRSVNTPYAEELTLKGKGGMGGLVMDGLRDLSVKCDYIYLGEEFYSPFMALSYIPGTEGIRVSSEFGIPVDRLMPRVFSAAGVRSAGISVFYKKLREVEPPASGMEKKEISFTGFMLEAGFTGGFGASAGYLDRGNWREKEVGGYDAYRKVYSATLSYSVNPRSSILAQYQRIDTFDNSVMADQDSESKADIYSVYGTFRF